MTDPIPTANFQTRGHVISLLGAACLALAVTTLSACDKTTQSVKPAPPIAAAAVANTAIDVRVDVTTGMTRGGKPYFVKGAGGSDNLKELANRGANSIRTWTTGGLAAILDESHGLGLTVSAGIWLEPECSWFSYKNPAHCDKQAERVRKEVTEFRKHPALLAWGIGNEAEGDGTNADYWKQLDRLALLVREIDPAHPTYTAVAGLSPAKAEGMNAYAPHLDYVGINTYGGVTSLRQHLEKIGWKRPWMLTEWGPRGFWESRKSASGAPIEQTSSEKAEMMRQAYQKTIRKEGGCLGSYVFVWGWKFEATATWFGLFTHEGDTTAVADVLQELWTATKPANQAPAIKDLIGVPKAFLTPGTNFDASVQASDPDGDPLVWNWAVLPELPGGQHPKKIPNSVPNTISKASGERVSVKAPAKPGIYRLHVWIKDGNGHAATANMPFEVR
jgi:hypothetical protein